MDEVAILEALSRLKSNKLVSQVTKKELETSVTEQGALEKILTDSQLASQLDKRLLLPIETFQVVNKGSLSFDQSEGCCLNDVTSEEEDEGISNFGEAADLPPVETWKVYPYVALGSLEDLLVDYFRSEARTTKTLGGSGSSSSSLELDQLFNLCVNLGADLCDLAMIFEKSFLQDEETLLERDFARIATSRSVYASFSEASGFQTRLKLPDSCSLLTMTTKVATQPKSL